MSTNGTSTAVTRVGWVGPRPSWLDDRTPAGIALVGDVSKADVVHVAGGPGELARLRRGLPPDCAVVLQVADETRLGARDLRRLRPADLVLVESASSLHELTRQLPATRVRLLPQPIDLDWYAPQQQLLETPLRGRDLRRFRRFHRLAPPVVLFAGPYTHDGGLDLALEAVVEVRKQVPEARLAAIPEGEVQQRYLDSAERQALALGHHGIIEWKIPDDERPFWYACADVVCAPSRSPVSTAPAAYAAAAGRPFVGSDFETLPDVLRTGLTGYVLPPNDLATLQAALIALTADEDEAHRLGDEARRWAERTLTPDAALADLAELWREAVARRRIEAAGPPASRIRLATRSISSARR